MVNGPVFISGEAQAYPPDILGRFKLPELGGMTDFPGRKDLAGFLKRTENVTRDLARFGLELFDLEPWDVFFICFLTLDRVMHFVWRYTDPNDPTYPGRNPLEDSIKQAFMLYDSIVGSFMERLAEDQALLVASDHGHGMRPPKALFVNEALRREGLLKTKQSRIPGVNPVALVERAKSTFLRSMQRLDLEDLVYRIAALIPKERRKRLKTSAYAVSRHGSVAWVSDVGGGTSFSGIEISRSALEEAARGRGRAAGPDTGTGVGDYEEVRDRVIRLVTSLKDKAGLPLVLWARRREEVFTGRNADKYPDVVFELAPGYGIDRTLFCGLTGITSTHKKVSGGHTQYGSLLVYGTDRVPREPVAHITSVYPLINQILK
jgi:predicted AlkP superfamily phosphohydrolase/phosphomutase